MCNPTVDGTKSKPVPESYKELMKVLITRYKNDHYRWCRCYKLLCCLFLIDTYTKHTHKISLSHTHTPNYTHSQKLTHKLTDAQLHTHTLIFKNSHINSYTHIHRFIHTQTNTTLIHTYTQTHTHTNTHS